MLICPQSLSHCRICLCPFVIQHLGCSCGKQNGSARWQHHFSSAMNWNDTIWPLDHWSIGNVAVLVLGRNITFGELHVPHVQLCHVSNKAISHRVLILSDDGGASGGDYVALCHTWTTAYHYTIFVESIVSVGAAPCEADMVPCIKVKTSVSIPFRKEERMGIFVYKDSVNTFFS